MIRDATTDDAEACAAIYAPYVTDSAISFELEAPSAAEMASRIDAAHAWLVLEEDGRVVGYAYGGPFRERLAYARTTEVSVYLEAGGQRTGAGRTLYAALLERLAQLGFRMAVGVMTLPNEASVGLHRSLGFTPVGTFHNVGFKHDAWHDVAWVQRDLTG